MLMTRAYRLFVAVLCQCMALMLPAGQLRAESTRIAAELIAEGPVAPGGTIMLAIHMRPAKGWHGYWLNPGDAGLGMKLDWSLPQGARTLEPRYPVPDRLLISGLMNHVYRGDYAVLVPLVMPGNAKPGSEFPISVDASWLACTDEICVPERARLSTSLRVGKPTSSSRFDEWRARLPAPLDQPARFAIAGNSIRLAIPLPQTLPLEDPHFFVANQGIVEYAAPQAFARAGDLLIVTLQRARFTPQLPDRLDGVLRLNAAGDGLTITAMPGNVPAGGKPIRPEPAQSPASLMLLLLGALAGGLLLNFMPCVFPILSLKALSLARAGESEAQARTEGMAYAGGVIAACMGLGALMLGLRAAGEEVGWAFQLQEPAVVAALLLLAVAITANFLGLFEFALPGLDDGGSARGAFATGLLTAFVATPCTGPFMAAAMGAALLLPVPEALALFAMLGLGLALPFLAVAFVPALRTRLPKPGPWMARFRRWMALPMGLTALALAWLASRVGGLPFAVFAMLLASALVGLLALVGWQQRRSQPAAAIALAGLAGIALIGLAILPRAESVPDVASRGLLDAAPFSEQALAEARATGRPVFVWFTADWCLTCKVNEQLAIEREATRDAFARAGVIVLRGDWTRRDPEITRYLTAQGAAGVPLYVWYPAGGGAAVRLEQLLTQDRLVALASQGR